jgi:anaerobic dimethyl sulfoxide reductase subunit C (anchor subunit)
MELAIGALFVLWMIRLLAGPRFSPQKLDRIIQNPILVISFTVIVAMIGAHFHLSKPFHSFYAVRNFGSSWLSREIVFTALFFPILSCLWFFSRFKQEQRRLNAILGWLAIACGSIVIYCMARIYLLPTQVAWNSSTVIASFFITALLLGTMTIACLLVLDLRFAEIQKAQDIEIHAQVIKYSMTWLTWIALLMVVVNVVLILYQIYLLNQGDTSSQISLRLLFELYLPLFVMRLSLIIVAPLWMGYAVYRMRKAGAAPQTLMAPVYMACLLILIGETVGRFLFYATHIRLGI